MPVFRLVIQQATSQSARQPAHAQSSDLRETIRQITADAQAAAQDAQVAAAQANAAAAAKRATSIGGSRGGRQITIDGHSIIVGPRAPDAPVLAGAPAGAYTIMPGGMENVIPPQAVDLAFGFFTMCAVMVIGWPLARAFGRRIERRSDTAAFDPAFAGQLQRIERAVDAMSIEIERISESQRFMAKLQNGAADRAALSSVERR